MLRSYPPNAAATREPHTILQLLDVFPYNDQLHLVLELGACDLSAVLRDRAGVLLTEAAVKGFIQQLLHAVAYCHSRRFMHRDIKPDNLLLTTEGVMKLADFGHATRFPDADAKPAFHRLVTIWYRAPELLFESNQHTPAIDMWSVGCILGETLLRQPLFPGRDERDQLACIFRLLGTPVDPLAGSDVAAVATVDGGGGVAEGAPSLMLESIADPLRGPPPVPFMWPGCSSLAGYAEFEERAPQPWRAIFPPAAASALAVDLISRLLVYDPARRLTAAQAMAHPWFSTAPLPAQPGELPLPVSARSRVSAPASGAGTAGARP